MDDRDLGWACGRLRTPLRLGPVLGGAVSSGASVRAATTPAGTPVVLKAARATTLERGRRELAFYLGRDAVPLRTPRLLEAVDDEDAVLLVLSRHPPTAPVATWGPGAWAALARDLAGLHGAALPVARGTVARGTVTRGTVAGGTVAETDGAPERVLEEFWAGEPGLLDRVRGARTDLTGTVAALPSGPVHGDLHPGNLLREDDGHGEDDAHGEDGGLVWIDWQEVGVGSPASDLGFLAARAVAAGADPPLDEVVVPEFCRHTGLQVATVARAVLAAELLVLVAQWPLYARFNSARAVAGVRRRVRRLEQAW